MNDNLDLLPTPLLDRAGVTTDTDSGTEKLLITAEKFHKKLRIAAALNSEPAPTPDTLLQKLPASVRSLAAEQAALVQQFFDAHPDEHFFDIELGSTFGHTETTTAFTEQLRVAAESDRTEHQRLLDLIVKFLGAIFGTANTTSTGNDVRKITVGHR